MKTVVSRMTAIKDMKAFDPEGESINKVEASLKNVNVDLRDQNGHFRDMQDVLMELSTRWSTFSTENQTFIAQQIGGVRQQNIILALLSNEAEIRKQLGAELDSNGLAIQRYGIYMKSVEAAQNEWTSSWERLATSISSKDTIVNIYELGAGILDLISTLGGIPTVLELIAVGFLAVQSSAIVAGIAAFDFGALLTGIGLTNPIGWIALAVGGLIIAFNLLNPSIEQVRANIENFNKEISNIESNISRLAKERSTISELSTEFENLKNNTSKTVDEQKRFYDIQQQIKDISPDVAGGYDNEGRFILTEGINLQTLINLKTEDIRLEKERLALTAQQGIGSQVDNYEKLKKDLADKTDLYNRAKELTPSGRSLILGMSTDDFKKLSDDIAKGVIDVAQAKQSIKTSFYSMGTDAQKSFRDGLKVNPTDFSSELLQMFPDRTKIPGSRGGSPGKMPVDEKSLINEDALIIAEAQKVFDKKVSLEQQFTLMQVDEAIKRATARGVAGEDELKYLENYRDEVIKANMDINGQFSQTAEASKQTMEGLSQAIWSQAQSANQVLYDMQGNVITSANGVYANLTQSNASFAAFVKQLALDTGKTAAEIYSMFSKYAGSISQFGKGEIPFSPTAPTVFSSGGGGSGETAAQKAAKEKIKHLDAEKKALQDRQKEYNKYIDSLKEELKLQKEEQTFLDDISAKNKSLAKMKSDIAILALDDSEEAKAKRLALEEDASKLETDITKTTESRKYDLELAALDKMKQDYQDGIDSKIAGLESEITKLNEVAQATSGGSGSVGSAYDELAIKTTNIINGIVANLSKMFNMSDQNKNKIYELVQGWITAGYTIDDATTKAINYYNLMQSMKGSSDWMDAYSEMRNDASVPVATHHSGVDSGFVGGLKTNESFVKAIKGEIIVNEPQMNNFMSNILPKMIKSGSGGITINAPLQIAGNVTQDTLPDLQKMMDKMVKSLNDSLKSRGIIRQSNLVSI